MASKLPALTIIIVNYNGQYWLKKTLQSLKTWVIKKTRYPVVVHVVDNGSSDDSVAMLKREFKWVEVEILPENLGFAAGNNVALAQAKTPYVMLLNSDVEATSQTHLDVLVDFMEQHPEIGVVTPQVVLPDGQLDWACHRGEPTPWASFSYMSGLAKAFPRVPAFAQYHLTNLNIQEKHQIDACTGAAMVVRNQAIAQVGLLDEQFFFYAEDLDWCRRFKEIGWQIWYHPGSSLIHHKNKSSLSSKDQATQIKTRRYFYDTMLQYYDKHYRQSYPGWVRSLVRIVLFIKKGGV